MLKQHYKLYDKCYDQCLLMPDLIIAMNERSYLRVLELNLDKNKA